jgi:hypothetical protein
VQCTIHAPLSACCFRGSVAEMISLTPVWLKPL